jgi:hypothetical protein
MSDLSSSSTLTEVEAAYDDNAGYAKTASLSKCRDFIEAARILLRRYPSTATKGANALSYPLDRIQKELDRAVEWLSVNSTTESDIPGPRVTRADFRYLR